MRRASRLRDLRGDLSRYPVKPEKIPLNMPVEHFHLVTTGHLLASECKQFGFMPAMGCARCGEPLNLFWRHKPLGENFFARRKGKVVGVPGTTWGEDVAPICRCCSFGKCRHKRQP